MIDKYYCPDWTNLTIQGNWYSPEYKAVSLVVERCRGNNCATEEEFQKWFKKITMQEIIVSSYFDVKEYEEPIKYFLDDYYVSLHYNRSVFSSIHIKKNNLQLHDDLFGIFNSMKEDYFYQKGEKNYFTTDIDEGMGKDILFY